MTSGGTIPDRGLSRSVPRLVRAMHRVGCPRRVGELDEEMVYESRVGDVFTLGTTSWRVEHITHDQVLVSLRPGSPGRLPFWKARRTCSSSSRARPARTAGSSSEVGAVVPSL